MTHSPTSTRPSSSLQLHLAPSPRTSRPQRHTHVLHLGKVLHHGRQLGLRGVLVTGEFLFHGELVLLGLLRNLLIAGFRLFLCEERGCPYLGESFFYTPSRPNDEPVQLCLGTPAPAVRVKGRGSAKAPLR